MERHDEGTCRAFVRMWAEAVIRQVQRVRDMRAKAVRDGRDYERAEDWSPTAEDLAANFRAQWTEEQTLVWAAYQLERWAERLAKTRHQKPPQKDKVLTRLRNALEHLDDAEFTTQQAGRFFKLGADGGWGYGFGESAVPGTGDENWSLRALPSSRLDIQTLQGQHGPAFGLIDVSELEERAEAYVRQIEDELMAEAEAEAESWWIEMHRDR